MPQQQMTEEQVKELQEKIKNMSSEELKEFQKTQCIFCQIISGRVQSKKVYEDEKCIAILDINPANPGHVLLLPKEHYSIMPQVPEEEIAHLFIVAKTLSNAVLRGLGVQGTNIIVQNGIAAGQKAQHFMIHIIPRKEKDGVNFEIPQKEIPEKELEAIRKKLEDKLGAVKEPKPKPRIQELIKQKEQQVVEAEFKEEKKAEEISKQSFEMSEKQSFSEHVRNSEAISNSLSDKSHKKPKKTRKKTKEEKQEPAKKVKEKAEKKESEEAVGLDDIARIIGVK